VASIADRIISGEAGLEEVVSFLRDFQERGFNEEDLLALTSSFRRQTIPVETVHPLVADLCGTGGGALRTFNISTVSSFVVAGAGVPVAKHGNRSNAGACGSADVMEALGANIMLRPSEAGKILDQVGISFFFAPIFNPAMKNASMARKLVGGRTIFNALGPLLNPANARRRQLIGVYDVGLLDLIPQISEKIGIERTLLVHGQPDIDEVSILGPTEATLACDGTSERFVIDPADHGLRLARPKEISDRSPERSALLAREILAGIESAARDVVVLNAACALWVFGCVNSIGHGIALAERTIDSGAAEQKLFGFVAATHEIVARRQKDNG
jgi:anthranilate phosphoribosyltransferase